MDELLRWLHLVAMAFFVGGQLLLAAVVVPAVRRSGTLIDQAARAIVLRTAARRFGTGSLVALAVLAGTGTAMAEDRGRWGDGILQVKLGLVAAVVLLIAAHARRPQRHALSAMILTVSLVVVYFGVELAH